MASNNPAFGRGFARAVNGQPPPGRVRRLGRAPQQYGAPTRTTRTPHRRRTRDRPPAT